ncbi:hypothetical protein Tco_0305302 [Tanacetum coccineum]
MRIGLAREVFKEFQEKVKVSGTWCNAKDTYGTREIHGRKGFWEDVFANFEKDMGGTIRRYDAIVSKWKNSICPKVAAFGVIYDGVKRVDENESSDLLWIRNRPKAISQPRKPTRCRLISSIPNIEEKADEHEIGPYLNEEEYQQLLVDEAAFKEHLEEEAKAKKERAIADKELEEFMKAEQAQDELFRMEFEVKSDSEYETD